MAISTHTELIDAVRDWLGRANDSVNLSTARVSDMISFGESEIYARLRIRQMETTSTLSLVSQSVPLPEGFIEARRLYIDASPIRPLSYRSPPQFWTQFKSVTPGRPYAYTIEGDSILFGPSPDAVYSASFLYYAKPAALSSALNSIFLGNPDLFLYAALMHAANFIGADDESRGAVFPRLFESALARVQAQSDRAVSGAPLTIQIG